MLATANTFEEATATFEEAAATFEEAAAPSKKQKTGPDTLASKKKAKPADAVKSVKKVDPAVIEQRRDTVFQRVLKLESKLAKDRALLEKYSIPNYSTDMKDGSESEEAVASDKAD